ncbi:OadG family transporter subunit [Desulfofundulus thermosubterraneus]|uniref:Oxaloacetate decarboxylase, gamma chain n=1 Tax=Desulfofundulus thermosubterraneus DSM 16057 TaxID=1121432 RepID=A0A1M6IYU9_9FIRM|nr:OadG family transporter subunit [Desulfofundulus thermosubterraneus]SHJ39570.1 Oxaloacetate decarboxylase, gamma chain [Desulfofundulus thermosubterraneus DSM 16057]
MIDWTNAVVVAISGIVSVFLALGILSAVVSFSGWLFAYSARKKAAAQQSQQAPAQGKTVAIH